MKRLVVHIERLTLKGLRGSSANEFGIALKRTLGLQLADASTVSWRLVPDGTDHLRCTSVRVGQGAATKQVAQAAGGVVAQAIMRVVSNDGMHVKGSTR